MPGWEWRPSVRGGPRRQRRNADTAKRSSGVQQSKMHTSLGTEQRVRRVYSWGTGLAMAPGEACPPYLTYSYMGIRMDLVSRAATTSDPFNAIAESRRRDILDYLAAEERAVGDIAEALGI